MVVMDPEDARAAGDRGRLRLPPGRLRSCAEPAPAAGLGLQAHLLRAAVEQKKITATIISDSPEVYSDWKPENFEKEEYHGPVRVRTALAQSINTVAIKVM